MAVNWCFHTQNWEVLWGGVGIIPVYGKCCDCCCGVLRGPTWCGAAPRSGGMKLAGLQLVLPAGAWSRTGTVLQWLPGSQPPPRMPQ